MTHYYWFLSDEKTVRQISWEEWRQITMKDWGRDTNTRLICRIESSYIGFRKAKRYTIIPLKQLRKVLAQLEES